MVNKNDYHISERNIRTPPAYSILAYSYSRALVLDGTRGVATGGIWGIYNLPKSVQVNFFMGYDVKTVIEREYYSFIPPQNEFLATPLGGWY